MAQVLIRNLDDAKMAAWRARARVNGRSLEAELRDHLHRGASLTPDEKRAIIERAWAESDRNRVPGVEQTPGWILIREDRDS